MGASSGTGIVEEEEVTEEQAWAAAERGLVAGEQGPLAREQGPLAREQGPLARERGPLAGEREPAREGKAAGMSARGPGPVRLFRFLIYGLVLASSGAQYAVVP